MNMMTGISWMSRMSGMTSSLMKEPEKDLILTLKGEGPVGFGKLCVPLEESETKWSSFIPVTKV